MGIIESGAAFTIMLAGTLGDLRLHPRIAMVAHASDPRSDAARGVVRLKKFGARVLRGGRTTALRRSGRVRAFMCLDPTPFQSVHVKARPPRTARTWLSRSRWRYDDRGLPRNDEGGRETRRNSVPCSATATADDLPFCALANDRKSRGPTAASA